MFAVEVELAGAVGARGGLGVATHGATAQMDDLGAGDEQDAAATSAQGGAQVDVVEVEEVVLVHQAGGDGRLASQHQAGTGHPAHLTALLIKDTAFFPLLNKACYQ